MDSAKFHLKSNNIPITIAGVLSLYFARENRAIGNPYDRRMFDLLELFMLERNVLGRLLADGALNYGILQQARRRVKKMLAHPTAANLQQARRLEVEAEQALANLQHITQAIETGAWRNG